MMGDFFVRNKIVKDVIAQQCLVALAAYIRYQRIVEKQHSEKDLVIGIVGAGMMGRIFIGFLSDRTLLGRYL